MANFFQKLFSKKEDSISDNEDGFPDWYSFEDTLNRCPEGHVSQYEAFQIAKHYLKNDFAKRDKRWITFLVFNKGTVNLTEDKAFWDIHITRGEISWQKKDGTFCDGTLVKEDFPKLHCAVSTQDGTYYYFDK